MPTDDGLRSGVAFVECKSNFVPEIGENRERETEREMERIKKNKNEHISLELNGLLNNILAYEMNGSSKFKLKRKITC